MQRFEARLALALGRPHSSALLRACFEPEPGSLRRISARAWMHARHATLTLRERLRRAVSVLGALTLFAGAVLAAQRYYQRGQVELAALVIRLAHEETIGTTPGRASRGLSPEAESGSMVQSGS